MTDNSFLDMAVCELKPTSKDIADNLADELLLDKKRRENFEEQFLSIMLRRDSQYAESVKLERAEAIKEFAKRLKESYENKEQGLYMDWKI